MTMASDTPCERLLFQVLHLVIREAVDVSALGVHAQLVASSCGPRGSREESTLEDST
jgi:hypothetical protein